MSIILPSRQEETVVACGSTVVSEPGHTTSAGVKGRGGPEMWTKFTNLSLRERKSSMWFSGSKRLDCGGYDRGGKRQQYRKNISYESQFTDCLLHGFLAFLSHASCLSDLNPTVLTEHPEEKKKKKHEYYVMLILKLPPVSCTLPWFLGIQSGSLASCPGSLASWLLTQDTFLAAACVALWSSHTARLLFS